MANLCALFLIAAAVAVAVAVLGGCAQTSPSTSAVSPVQTDTAAVLVQPGDVARQELRASVARMMGVANVAVASDALLHTSLMVIEKNRPRGAGGIQLSGRDYDKPEQFRLFKSDKGCVLVKLSSGARELLRESKCTAEP